MPGVRRAALSLFIVAAAVTGCGDDAEDAAPTPTPADNAADSDVRVRAVDSAFAPAEVTVAGGTTVEVTLANDGALPHTFTIDALDIDEELGPGDEQTVSVDLDEGYGRLEFYCRFHVTAGMEGVFVEG